MKRIKSIPKDLRPREKLLKLGSQALSMTELIAVLLTTGTQKRSVLAISQDIAGLIEKKRNKYYQKEKQFLSLDDIVKLGIGPHKASQILASQEIGIRMTEKDKMELTNPDAVFANSKEIINSEKESLLCFYLNARGELLKKELIAVGSLNKVSILPREIFLVVKEMPVSSIILVHNHPSDVLDPSIDDILFTKRVKKAGEILGVKLLDHLIVGKSGWKKIRF